MLMMTRKRGERLFVGEIEIIVSEIARSHVRLAVRAPAGQLILRGEVRDTIEAQNRAAAASQLDGAPKPEVSGTQDLRAFVGKRQ